MVAQRTAQEPPVEPAAPHTPQSPQEETIEVEAPQEPETQVASTPSTPASKMSKEKRRISQRSAQVVVLVDGHEVAYGQAGGKQGSAGEARETGCFNQQVRAVIFTAAIWKADETTKAAPEAQRSKAGRNRTARSGDRGSTSCATFGLANRVSFGPSLQDSADLLKSTQWPHGEPSNSTTVLHRRRFED
eukprot:s330_g4.t1